MITLIHGGEGYLVDRAARELLEPIRTAITLEFNYEDLQADTLNADAFAEKAGTLPFIDSQRVLVLRDWGLLAGKRDKGAGAERAAAYMKGIPESTHLVLIAHTLATRSTKAWRRWSATSGPASCAASRLGGRIEPAGCASWRRGVG